MVIIELEHHIYHRKNCQNLPSRFVSFWSIKKFYNSFCVWRDKDEECQDPPSKDEDPVGLEMTCFKFSSPV